MSCAGCLTRVQRRRSTGESGIPIVGAMGEKIGRPVCRILSIDRHDRPVREVGPSLRLPCVDQPRHEPGASVVATPPPGRGVGHHAVRGRPPEPEQSLPKRFVGGQDPALVFRMRTAASVSRKRVPAIARPLTSCSVRSTVAETQIHAESDDGHVDPRPMHTSTWLRRRNGINRLTATERSELVSVQVHRARYADRQLRSTRAANKPGGPLSRLTPSW